MVTSRAIPMLPPAVTTGRALSSTLPCPYYFRSLNQSATRATAWPIQMPEAKASRNSVQSQITVYPLRLLEHLAQPRVPALLLIPLNDLRYLRPLADQDAKVLCARYCRVEKVPLH